MGEFIASASVGVAIIVVWAWRVERRGRQHREVMRAWMRDHVPTDEIPEHLR